MKKPDFIIGGVARSASTWLCHALDTHPQVYLPHPFVPEPKFFSRDSEFAKGLDWYCRQWFADAPEGKVCGEKSTSYLETPGTAARIFAHLPDVKMVFLLRNPVDRAFSNYYWSRHNGLETESFERAVELEKERELALPEHLKQARPFSYVSRGFYVDQLREYFALFPKENILCLKTEDIARAPNTVVNKLFRFLGLNEIGIDYEQLGMVNLASNEEEAVMPPEMRDKLEAIYKESNAALAALLGEGFATW